jgi:Holliday junction resolvase-like predicted endonuclease
MAAVRTSRQQSGDAAETLVASRLAAAGWDVLGRNVRIGRGELDLVAIDPGPPAALVVVEVRRRAGREFGLPEETFGWRKRRHLRAAAFGLLELGRLPDGGRVPRLPLRFDLVLVEPATVTNGPDVVRHHRHVVAG